MQEVFSCDSEVVESIVDARAFAFLVLFPISVRGEKFVDADPDEYQDKVFFMKQEGVFWVECFFSFTEQPKLSVDNACGTVALLHALMNNLSSLQIAPDSSLEQFVQKALEARSLAERTQLLAKTESIKEAHEVTHVREWAELSGCFRKRAKKAPSRRRRTRCTFWR